MSSDAFGHVKEDDYNGLLFSDINSNQIKEIKGT